MNIIEKIDRELIRIKGSEDGGEVDWISKIVLLTEAKQEIEHLQEEKESAKALLDAQKREIERIDSAYILAANGRKNFREAYRNERSELKEAHLQVSTLLSENERLRSERIDLVKYCMDTQMGWHSINDNEATEVITQFEKERQ